MNKELEALTRQELAIRIVKAENDPALAPQLDVLRKLYSRKKEIYWGSRMNGRVT